MRSTLARCLEPSSMLRHRRLQSFCGICTMKRTTLLFTLRCQRFKLPHMLAQHAQNGLHVF